MTSPQCGGRCLSVPSNKKLGTSGELRGCLGSTAMLGSGAGMDVSKLQRLHDLVTRAIEATTAAGVAKVLVDAGMAALGASSGGVWLIRAYQLENVHFGGELTAPQLVSPAGDSALAACVREQESQWLATPAEHAARFPMSAALTACACLPLLARGRAIGAAAFASRQTLDLSADKVLLSLFTRQCAQALEQLQLIDAERAARRHAEQLALRMDALQAATVRLAAVHGIEQTARTIISDVRTALHGTGVGLWLVEDDVAVLCAHEGWSDAAVTAGARIPMDGKGPLAEALRSRRLMWIERDSAALRFAFVPEQWQNVHSGVNVPLVAEGRLIGAFCVTFEQQRTFDVGDREFLDVYAVHAAQAIHRVRLVEETTKLAGRMTALQAIAARLGEARGFDEVARIVIDEAISAIGASTAALWQLQGPDIVLAIQVGSPSSVIENVSRIGIAEGGALAEAVRSRTPQYLESRAVAQERNQFQEVRWAVIEAAAFVPLVAHDRLLGVIGLGFAQPRRFDSGERELIELFAGHVAQAIARGRDDRAQRFLAEASSSLAGSLDAHSVLQRVGELIVEEFADWCFVDLTRADGSLERAIVAHADPADHALAEELRRVGAPMTTGVPNVIESQKPLIIERLSEQDLTRTQHDAQGGRLARALRAQSVLCVPMSVGGRAIGAITWIGRTRSLDARDVQIAAQIARAAAASLDNARLYQAEAASARRLGKLYELTVALSSARTPEDVANVTTQLGAEATGALSGFVWMRDSSGAMRAIGAHAPIEWVRQWSVLPAGTSLPAHRVIETGESVWMESTDNYEREAPAAFASARAAGRVNAFVALPLVVGGARRGVLSLSWQGNHHFEPDERTLLLAIARSCEQALERAELYTTEAHARAAAEAASRVKDEFLAMLGHELRNPLAPIVTALELMRMRGIEDGADERAVIERQVQHLARLVDDLLDISRITRGKIELRRTRDELIRAIEPAIEAVSMLFVQHRHQLQVVVPATGLRVDADIQRLSQVVRNLLTNAAKFSAPGARVEVTARLVEADIELVVSDNGRGIAPELLPHVFEPFVQGTQSTERAGGGLGLGLAIVKNIVEVHGGSVSIASDGNGTRVSVRLPCVVQPDEVRPAGQAASRSVQLLRVLVVDDNVDAAELLGELLRLLGHHPIIAHDGDAALAMSAQTCPELAILDLGLPGMDGYELARKLKSNANTAQLPIVALSGYGQPSDRERSFAAGFLEHLVKPIERQQLQAVIDRFALPPR
jgi:signal transduction histidine kinase/CheY-like chemotaxis protein/putative methionine-R-sulfoxide reductase with GAF domain